jgi:hypothetical protein
VCVCVGAHSADVAADDDVKHVDLFISTHRAREKEMERGNEANKSMKRKSRQNKKKSMFLNCR